jgi:trimeric autotransporter adhesin
MKTFEVNPWSKLRLALLLFCCIAAIASGSFAQDATSAVQSNAPASQVAPTSQSATPQQTSPAPQAAPSTSVVAQGGGGVIHGIVKSGNQPLPGVTITAANTLTGQKVSTSSDLDGSYILSVPSNGRYVVRAQMPAFAVLTQEVRINAGTPNAQADLELVLLSRAPKLPTQQEQAAAMGIPSGQGNGAGNQRFQSMVLMQGDGSENWQGGGDQSGMIGAAMAPGMSDTTATESVAVSGNTTNPFGNMSSAEMQQRFQEIRQQYGNGLPGSAGGGFGSGFGGGFGGFNGGGGGPFVLGGGGRGRFNINQPHGSVYYSVQDGGLNASPFSVNGEPTSKPSFITNTFGGSFGGPLNIPKIYNGGTKTFFFANYNGSRGETPFDEFSTVPTAAERAGNFTGIANIVDPSTGLPFTNDTISQINPAAQGLLQFIPLPNLPGNAQNFHFVTATDTSSDDLNIRLNRTLGAAPTRQPGSRGRGGRGPRNSLSFGLHYHHSDSNLTNAFPSLGGTTSIRSWDVPIGYTRTFGRLINTARVEFNSNRSQTRNLFAFSQNVAGNLGIQGVSQNPFDWGVPNLSFRDVASLSDASPSLVRNTTLTFSDNMIWSHGKHTLRWGGDFRRLMFDAENDSNPRGTFTFTGAFTGYDFADFLLGLPQATTVQYGATPDSTRNFHFRGNSWDLYAQDEWRVRGNLSFNLGVRYEYISPYSETSNQLVNLSVSPTFNPAVTPATLLAGQDGVPQTIVKPDRNNFAPRIGIAWKPLSKTVVRSGYGINYNLGEYQDIGQNLAFQPPFATAQTNTIPVGAAPTLSLQNGFPAPAAGQITNNFAVDPNYKLGYVQMWDLDVQQEIKPTLLLNVDYTGSKGTDLDILEAPNRTITGNSGCANNSLVWCNVAPFYLESSQGSSILHAGSLRIRKRLQKGVSLGGTYTYSKSLDNASSIGNGIVISTAGLGGGGGFGGGGGGGGGGTTSGTAVVTGSTSVAQNPLNLAAERGLSSFNQTHRFTADYLWELPIGKDKKWLANGGVAAAILGDWQWSGDWTITSGLPFTPVIVGNETEVGGGTNGTLRPDVIGNVALAGPVFTSRGIQWFNTAAFQAPAAGQYGNAGRNSIVGPGTILFDMAMTKVFPMAEGRMLEFRINASNVFNHPNFSTIDTNFNSPTFGLVTGAGSMRTVQLQARFRF